jgi:hypothetical protein
LLIFILFIIINKMPQFYFSCFIFIFFIYCSFSSQSIILEFHKNNKHKIEKINETWLAENLRSFLPKDYPNSFIFSEELPLINSNNDEMIVNLCLGTPKQCFNVLVDSGSFYLWVADKNSINTPDVINKFDSSNSSTFIDYKKSYSLRYGTGSANGNICSDVLSLGKNTTLSNLNFILVNSEEGHSELDGILGMGYYYDDFEYNALKFSIIDRLYDEKLITRKLFTQKYTDDKKGLMVIGDMPEEILNDMGNYGYCPAIKSKGKLKNPRWECILKATFYGYSNENLSSGNLQKIETEALFDTGTNLILVPLNYLKNLFTTYFKDLANRGDCKLSGGEDAFYSIICSRYANLFSLPPLNFIFGDWILRMNTLELFYRYPDNTIRFGLVSNLEMNMWIFGEPLLKKFHMVFDKDNDQIGFYGTEDKFKSDLPIPEPIDGFLVFIIIVSAFLFVSIVVYAVYYFIKKKRNTVEYYDPSKYYIHSK